MRRGGVVRGTKRAAGPAAGIELQAADRGDTGDFERFRRRQRRQQRRQARRQHALAAARRPDHQQAMPPGSGDHQRPFGLPLARHIGQRGQRRQRAPIGAGARASLDCTRAQRRTRGCPGQPRGGFAQTRRTIGCAVAAHDNFVAIRSRDDQRVAGVAGMQRGQKQPADRPELAGQTELAIAFEGARRGRQLAARDQHP